MWARDIHRVSVGLAVLGMSLVGARAAQAAPVELRNDGFESNMAAGFQAGFVAGEIGAVRLDLPSPGTYQITKVTLLFGGSTNTQTVTLHIWAEDGNNAPGAEIFSGDYQLTGSNEALSEINLAADNVMTSGSFRVGIEFQHTGLPSIARDDDGSIRATHNFIFAQGLGWVRSQTLDLVGDWVIRATVDNGGPGTPDAAPGTPDAAQGGDCQVNSQCPPGEYCSANGFCTFDCRMDNDCGGSQSCNSLGQCVDGGGGGCGCQVGAATRTASAAASFLLFGVLVVLRRRRKR